MTEHDNGGAGTVDVPAETVEVPAETLDVQAETVEVRRGMFGPHGTGDTSGYGRLVRTVQLPGATPRPYGGYFDETADSLERVLGEGDVAYGDAVEKVVIERDELTFHVRREALVAVMRGRRDVPALRFEMCMGASGAHYPEETGRELHVVYPLLSVTADDYDRVNVAASFTGGHPPPDPDV